MSVTIYGTNLSFKAMSKRSSTNRIILHHAAAKTASPEQIHEWHLNNGWSGAGYHFLVRKNGKIYRLRPENMIGAHASGNNYDSIGICFEGDFMHETMSDTQAKAGAELVSYLKSRYGISKVQRHKDVGATDCPGKNFPFDKIAKGGSSTSATTSDNGSLNVDGWIGVKTNKKAQKYFGLKIVDGVMSNQDPRQKKYYPRIDSKAIDYGNGNGSNLVGAMQRLFGVNDDGFMGIKTVKAMQKFLVKQKFLDNDDVDGILGKNTASAWQKWLNKKA